jgi:protein gp37
VSDGCKFCYAETQSKRNPAVLGVWGDNGKRVIAGESYWKMPVKWNRDAAQAGVRRRVFCASLADWLEHRPELIAPRRRLLTLIRDTPHLDWLLLSKRPEGWEDRLHEVVRHTHDGGDELASHWLDGEAPANVWPGVSIEDQPNADKRVWKLLHIPGVVRFLSVEPLLGPTDLTRLRPPSATWLDCLAGREHIGRGIAAGDDLKVDWVIIGGESGGQARPCNLAWIRALVGQCREAGTAVFVKQLGAVPEDTGGALPGMYGFRIELNLIDKKGGNMDEFPEDLRVRQFPKEKVHGG